MPSAAFSTSAASGFWLRGRAWIGAHPLAAPLLAGVGVRVVAAIVAVGFHARDDYFHVLEPALRWLADPSYDWDHSDAPGAGIRSHLVPAAVWWLLRLWRWLGVHDPTTALRLLGLVCGAYSLLVIPAVFLLARRLLSERGAVIATWLAAVHFAMPYAGTRLLIEAMAMPPLVFAVWLATYPHRRHLFGAGLLLALACWLRFQVVAAGAGLVLAVAVSGFAVGRFQDVARRLTAITAGALCGVAAQGLFDLHTTGGFLLPMLRNIAVNLDPDPRLSRSSAVAYLGIWLLLTVPPATLVVVPALVQAGRRLPLVAWPFLSFVLLHSLVPHKEERFMLPVLPLFLVLLAAAPSALATAGGRAWEVVKRGWPASRRLLVVIHVLLLGISITAQSQANLKDAMLALRDDGGARGVVSMGPELQAYFLDRPELVLAGGEVDAVWLARTLRRVADQPPNRFLAFAPDRMKAEILLLGFGLQCEAAEEISGWWLDRLLYRLNPARNRRRSPVLLWRCEPPAVAARQAPDNDRAPL